ncbi:hypothetical protein N0B31_18190 [Salinirubellus salinus]|jgi:hypothetical protein|uniref:Uncharacterized protein n=1 Tax=Salinirubellus salinus TaxID=1364945 RepID=A0A9E7R1Z2_9EURY|nr:hypothetical protein [Salinirubellus salinus]UWM54037.1 hypothetical protein N0B31_18190 [Salinirubellus salinus]
MSQSLPSEWFVAESRQNAILAWVVTALLGVTAVLHFLFGSLVVMAVAGVAAAVAIVPAVVLGSWRSTVPWPMLVLAGVALLPGLGPSFVGDFVFAAAIAGLSILVVVVLQMTTAVRMTPNFAIGFVVIATMGTASLWALGSAASARWLGTSFVETNDQLMIVFTAALLASLVSALAFRWYFRRQLEANAAERAGEVVA